MLKLLQSWMLPIAMLIGAIFHHWIGIMAPFTPILLFFMMILTFCRITPQDLRLRGLHAWLLGIQLVGSVAVYALLKPFDTTVAQGAMLCVLTSPATASAVVSGMLGGDVAFTAGFMFVSNMGVAVAAPVIFSLIGTHSELPFLTSVFYISWRVFPLLILPLVCAWTMQKYTPKLHAWLQTKTMAAFYMWAVSLTIVMGSTINFMLAQNDPDYSTELWLAGVAAVICLLQFMAGKLVGGMFGDRISGGQALGQKNTVLAIWMTFTYMNPLASIAPASYAIWQNVFNSWQLWRKRRNG